MEWFIISDMANKLTREEKMERAAEKRRLDKSKAIRKNVVFSVLSAVMPKAKALQLAGYSPGNTSMPEVISPGTVQQVRERLNQVAGCTLADQIGWYASVRENEDVPMSERIAAAKQIDKNLGYEAPQKVDVSQRYEIAGAVAVFHKLLSETGMRPSELAQVAEAEVVEPKQENNG